MAFTVTSPLVVVRQANGGFVHVYEGGTIPADSDEDHVKQLLDGGMIAQATSDFDPSDGPPAKSASKADWVAYAVAQGADPDEANALKKDELVDQYGAE